MAKTILNNDQKMQVVRLLKKTDMSVQTVADTLGVPMECVRSLKAHVTMGTYDHLDEEISKEISSAQETTLSIEKDLQGFISANLDQVERGLSLYEKGTEYVTNVGRIDILAIDNEKNFVVIELKAGKASDSALGQVLGYMGYVSDQIAKEKSVRGVIIASDFEDRLKYAARQVPNISLKSYKVNFSFQNVE